MARENPPTHYGKKGTISQKIRWLKQALILSGVLNILFLGIFFYFFIHQNPFPFEFEPAPTLSQSERIALPQEVLHIFLKIPKEKTISLLQDKQLVQDGYRNRDIALALLVFRESLDVSRALGKKHLAIRTWKVGSRDLILYPGLKDEDFEKITQFIKKEKWPQTPQGLHRLLKEKKAQDLSLCQAFCMTQEFRLLEELFSHSGKALKKGTILSLALELNWNTLHEFAEDQKNGLDLSESKRRELLKRAIKQNSRTAAHLLLLIDSSYALKNLDNEEVLRVIQLLAYKTADSTAFLHSILSSQRPDEVLQEAKKKCELFEISEKKEVSIKKQALIAAKLEPNANSIKELRPVFRQSPPASPSPSLHVIQPGESLWTISRKYHVSLEAIMQRNQLSSTTIRAGRTLKIPNPK